MKRCLVADIGAGLGASRSPHILACDGSNLNLPFGFACLGCGKRMGLHSPIEIRSYIYKARAFIRAHRACLERP